MAATNSPPNPNNRDQATILNELKKAFSDFAALNENLSDLKTTISNLTEQIKEKQSKGEDVSDFQNQVATAQKKIDEITKDAIPKAKLDIENLLKEQKIVSKTQEAAAQKFQNILKNIRTGIIDFVLKGLDLILEKYIALITFTLDAMNPLEYLELIGEYATKYKEIQQTLENIRQEFGALNQGSAKFIFDTAEKADEALKNIGLSSYQILGAPSQVLEKMFGFIKEMGPAGAEGFRRFGAEAINNLMIVQKGLGLTTEDMIFLTQSAFASRRSLGEITAEIINLTTAMGKQINESPKVIARSVLTAMKDLGKFGGATVAQLVKADGYLRRLGTDLEKVSGLMSTFENIEGSAEASSKLAQYFGVTVDAFKLLMAQDPAEMAEELRKGFRNAGVEVADFNRHGMALLQDTLGIDAQVAKTVLSLMNQGEAYQVIEAGAENAAKAQLTEAEALNKISDSIERLVHATESNIFSNIIGTIDEGIMQIDDAKKVMQSFYNEAVRIQEAGLNLGKMLYETLPGLKPIFESLKKLLDGKFISNFFSSFTNDLGKFFKMITSGNGSFASIWDQMKKTFFSYFDSASPEGKKLLENIKEFLIGMRKVIVFFIENILQELTASLTGDTTKGRLNEAVDGFGGLFQFAFVEVLNPIGEALAKYLPPFIGALWDKVFPFLSPLFTKIGQGFAYLITDVIWPAIEAALGWVGSLLKISFYGFIVLGPILWLVKSTISIATALKAAKAAATPADLAGAGQLMTSLTPVLLSFAAVLVAFGVMIAIISASGAKPDQIISASVGILIITGAILMILKAIPALSKSTKDIDKKGLFLGILAASAVVGAAALILGLFLSLTKTESLKPGIILEAAAALLLLSTFMIAISLALVPLSLAIGAIVSGPQAFILAAGLLTVGVILAGIAVFVNELSKILISIIDAIKLAPDQNAIKSAMEALQNLFFLSISLLTLAASDKIKEPPENHLKVVIEQINKLVGSVVDLIMLITNLDIDAGRLAFVDSFVKVFETISKLMTTIIEAIKLSTPNSEVLEKEGEKYANLLAKNSQISVSILTNIKDLFDSIKEIVLKTDVDPTVIARLNSISRVINSLSVFIDIIKVLSEHVKGVLDVSKQTWFDYDLYSKAIDAPKEFLTAILNTLGGQGGFIQNFIEQMNKVKLGSISKEKVESIGIMLKSIAEFMQTMLSGELLNLIREIMKGKNDLFAVYADFSDEYWSSAADKKVVESAEKLLGIDKQKSGNVGLLTDLTGTIAQIAEKMIPLIETIFKQEGIMDKIYEFSKKLEDSKAVEKFKAVSDLFGIIAQIMNAIKPIDPKSFNTENFVKNITDAQGNVKTFYDTTPIADRYLEMTQRMPEIIGGLLFKFELFLSSISSFLEGNVTIGSIRKVKAITELLTAYANMIVNIINATSGLVKDLSGLQIQKDKKSEKKSINNLKIISEAILQKDGILDTLIQKLPAMTERVLALVTGNAFGGIDEGTIKKIENGAKVIEMVTGVIKMISEVLSLFDFSNIKEPNKETINAAIDEKIDSINTIFDKIFGKNPLERSVLTTLTDNLIDNDKLSEFAKGARESIRSLKGLNDVLKEVTTMIDPLKKISTETDLETTGLDGIFKNISSLTASLLPIVKMPTETKESAEPIPAEDDLKTVANKFRSITLFEESILSGIKSLTNISKAIEDFNLNNTGLSLEVGELFGGNKIKNLSNNLNVLAQSLSESESIGIIDSFTASLFLMTDATAVLNKQFETLKNTLNSISEQPIKVDVNQVNGTKIEGKRTYEMNVSPELKVNLNIQVQMDAKQIDSALYAADGNLKKASDGVNQLSNGLASSTSGQRVTGANPTYIINLFGRQTIETGN